MVFIRWEKLLVDWIDSLGLVVVGSNIGSIDFEAFISKLHTENMLNSNSIADFLKENFDHLDLIFPFDPIILASLLLYISCKNCANWKLMKAGFTLEKAQQEVIVKFGECLEKKEICMIDLDYLKHAVEVATRPAQISTPRGTLKFMSPGAIIRTPSPIETPKMVFIKSQIQELNIVKKELFQEKCHSEDIQSLLMDSEEIRKASEKETHKNHHEVRLLREKVHRLENDTGSEKYISSGDFKAQEKGLKEFKKLKIQLEQISDQISESIRFNTKEFSNIKRNMTNLREELSSINIRLEFNDENLQKELESKDITIKQIYERITEQLNLQFEYMAQPQIDPYNSAVNITGNDETLGFVVELQLQEERQENIKLKEMLAVQNKEIVRLNTKHSPNQERKIEMLEVSNEELLIAILRQEKLNLQDALKRIQLMDTIDQLKFKLCIARNQLKFLDTELCSVKQQLEETVQKYSQKEREHKMERDNLKKILKVVSDEIEEVVLMNSYLEIDLASLNQKLQKNLVKYSKKSMLLKIELNKSELKNDEQSLMILNLREELMGKKESKMESWFNEMQNSSKLKFLSCPDLYQTPDKNNSNQMQKLQQTIADLKTDCEDINFLTGQLDLSHNYLMDLSFSIDSIKSLKFQTKRSN